MSRSILLTLFAGLAMLSESMDYATAQQRLPPGSTSAFARSHGSHRTFGGASSSYGFGQPFYGSAHWYGPQVYGNYGGSWYGYGNPGFGYGYGYGYSGWNSGWGTGSFPVVPYPGTTALVPNPWWSNGSAAPVMLDPLYLDPQTGLLFPFAPVFYNSVPYCGGFSFLAPRTYLMPVVRRLSVVETVPSPLALIVPEPVFVEPDAEILDRPLLIQPLMDRKNADEDPPAQPGDVPPPPLPDGVPILNEFGMFPFSNRKSSTAEKVHGLRYQSLGDSEFRKGNYVEADSFYRAALDVAPDRRAPYLRMSFARVAQQNFSSALQYLKAGLQVPEDSSRSWVTAEALYGTSSAAKRHSDSLVRWMSERPLSSDRQLLTGAFLHLRGLKNSGDELLELASHEGVEAQLVAELQNLIANSASSTDLTKPPAIEIPNPNSPPQSTPSKEEPSTVEVPGLRFGGPQSDTESGSAPETIPQQSSDSSGSTSDIESAKREPLTWEHVYGKKRISLGGSSPLRITWLDDASYIERESQGWVKVDAATGTRAPWYDAVELAAGLKAAVRLSDEEAEKLAAGGWMEVLPSQRLVVFRIKDQLIRMSLDGGEPALVSGVPQNLELATISPIGSGVAYVYRDELWVADFLTKQVRQLTHDAGPAIRNGKADWVYFEEIYNRKWQAYRWSPDGKSIAFQQFNDSKVSTFQISDHLKVSQEFETEYYPKAGAANPTVRLGVVSVDGGPIQWLNTSAYPAEDFLLVHFNWFPDSQQLYWYAQNRIQTWLDVLIADATSGESPKLLRDSTAAWIDNPGDVKFLADGSFLFFSERTGWRHLYRVTTDGQQTPVTAGEWEVRELLAVSEDDSSIVITATKDSPIAEQIYRVSLAESPGEVTCLSDEEGWHVPNVSLKGSFVVDQWSSLLQPPKVELRDASGKPFRTLVHPVTVPHDKYRLGTVEFRDVPMADGSTTTAIFVLPPDFDPKENYPIWLRTYGGPHAPNVKNAWNSRLVDHLLANLGIVVITFDPRTASGYSARSAWKAYRQLGIEETRDLVSLCDWLATQNWVDASRIGMSGHSYGGYFTSYAMTHCDKLCAGIAGAPVTDWANYDTIYTERFMSTPADNPDGYRRASVVAEAAKLNGKLLLIHGLKDDNVHPENTIQLTHALQQSDLDFDLMLYPTARHGIFGDHYNKLMFNFIVEAMGKPEAKQP
jgi:dipeptidyl aminopeptidase/acylaminoacyl peptidase